MTPEHRRLVSVGIVLDIDESPFTLYIWAHLVAKTMIDELRDSGVVARLSSIDVDGYLCP